MTETRHARRIDLLPKWAEGCLRFVSGKTIKYGADHDGLLSNRQHQAIRLGALPALGFIVWLRFTHPFLYDTLKWFVILAIPTAVVTWVVWRLRNVFLFRNDLYPVARGLRKLAGWESDPVKPWHWLHFPLDWRSEKGSKFRIDIKHDAVQTDKDKELFTGALSEGLNRRIELQDVTWHKDVRKPHCIVRLPVPPPSKAMWADYLDVINGCASDSQVVLGIGQDNTPIIVDLDNEYPHGLTCSDPGGGKSFMEASIGAQLAHKDTVLVVIDPKRISLQAFKGLPNVAYFAGVEECADGWRRLRLEMDRRAELIGDMPHGVKLPRLKPRIIILSEEADTQERDFRDFWFLKHGTRNSPQPITDMIATRAMGRELGMHQWVISLSGSARALGGGDARSLFGFQLVRGDLSVWKKVAPQIEKPPGRPKHRGRFYLVRPGELTAFQGFKFVDPPAGEEEKKLAEARDYASNGRVAEMPRLLDRRYGTDSLSVSEANPDGLGSVPSSQGVGSRVGHLRLVPDPDDTPADGTYRMVAGDRPRPLTEVREGDAPRDGERLFTLKQAVDDGIVTRNYEALRKAARAKLTPVNPNESPFLYRESDLRALDASRERTNA